MQGQDCEFHLAGLQTHHTLCSFHITRVVEQASVDVCQAAVLVWVIRLCLFLWCSD